MMTEDTEETNVSGITNQCVVFQVDSMEQDRQKVKAESSDTKLIERYIE